MSQTIWWIWRSFQLVIALFTSSFASCNKALAFVHLSCATFHGSFLIIIIDGNACLSLSLTNTTNNIRWYGETSRLVYFIKSLTTFKGASNPWHVTAASLRDYFQNSEPFHLKLLSDCWHSHPTPIPTSDCRTQSCELKQLRDILQMLGGAAFCYLLIFVVPPLKASFIQRSSLLLKFSSFCALSCLNWKHCSGWLGRMKNLQILTTLPHVSSILGLDRHTRPQQLNLAVHPPWLSAIIRTLLLCLQMQLQLVAAIVVGQRQGIPAWSHGKGRHHAHLR